MFLHDLLVCEKSTVTTLALTISPKCFRNGPMQKETALQLTCPHSRPGTDNWSAAGIRTCQSGAADPRTGRGCLRRC